MLIKNLLWKANNLYPLNSETMRIEMTNKKNIWIQSIKETIINKRMQITK